MVCAEHRQSASVQQHVPERVRNRDFLVHVLKCQGQQLITVRFVSEVRDYAQRIVRAQVFRKCSVSLQQFFVIHLRGAWASGGLHVLAPAQCPAAG